MRGRLSVLLEVFLFRHNTMKRNKKDIHNKGPSNLKIRPCLEEWMSSSR